MAYFPRETELQKKAFEFYYLLYEKRTLKKVAQKFKRSLSTIKKWSSRYNWKKRIRARELEDLADFHLMAKDALEEMKQRELKLIKESLDLYDKRLKKKKIDIDSTMDLDRLVKLRRLLSDEPTGDEQTLKIEIERVITEKTPEN